ncbi:MAG: hypothetical protein ACRDT0_01635 [Pseudonocardiaceae bacterium]
MKIGIIGMGHVGTTMCQLWHQHADVVTFDIADGQPYPHEHLAACDFATICVDTPWDETGACDTANVFEAVKRVPTQRVLLKSTVPPGTTDHLAEATGKQVCFSPEYVGQSTYHQPFWSDDAAVVPFVIFGGHIDIRHYFIDAFLPVLGPSKTYFQCSAREAEVIKYMENTYFATKISFVNEFYEICRVLGADWHTVREGWLLDPRIEPMHTAVFADERGFAGKCLPKDTTAIVHAATEAGYQPRLLAEVLRSNERFRTGV